jgi:protein TonB
MGQPASILTPTPPPREYPVLVPTPRGEFRFRSLVFTERSRAAAPGVTLAVSVVIHATLLVMAIVAPLLLFDDALPATELGVRAFFAAPPELAPAPPPPPPPPAAIRPRSPQAQATPPPEPARFVAPVEVPDQLPAADEALDLGVEGGVPGGVEGGVPGGVVGGIIGGLPQAAAPEPSRPVVRIGGSVRAPKLLYEVTPVYPPLAVQGRIQGVVILEAHVGIDGRVQSVRVVSGNPVLDQAAIEAVKQRRYQPLLLNGVPTEFILTMTMGFRLVAAAPGS